MIFSHALLVQVSILPNPIQISRGRAVLSTFTEMLFDHTDIAVGQIPGSAVTRSFIFL